MRKILVADDEEDLRTLLALICQTTIECEVLSAANGRQAIELIQSNPNIDLIVCDFFMPEGDGKTVFDFVRCSKRDIPFVVCTGNASVINRFEGPNFKGLIEKPLITEPLRNTLLSLFPPVSEPSDSTGMTETPRSEADPDAAYVSVSTRHLLRMGILNVDLYLKLGPGKYLKVMRQGDSFENADLARYSGRQITHLHVLKGDSSHFIRKLERDISHLIQLPRDSVSSAYQISASALQTIQDVSSQLGLSTEIQVLTQTAVEYSIRTIQSHPELNSLLVWPKGSSEDDYIVAHSVILAHVACGISGLLGWLSETTYYKLVLAAFLHDLPLKDPALARIKNREQLMEAASKGKLQPEQVSLIENHPALAAKLAEQMKGCPPDVTATILEHHERPDGSGFPAGLQYRQMSPLSILLVFGHELVDFMLERSDSKPAIADFLTTSELCKVNNGMLRRIVTAIALSQRPNQ